MNLDLPPEAFTRKTLQEAFSWLQEQPKEVRETIHTPERLVSFYQKSQRLKGREEFLRSEKFIHNLKKLAGHESPKTPLPSEEKSSDQKPKIHSEIKSIGQILVQKENQTLIKQNWDPDLLNKTSVKTEDRNDFNNQNLGEKSKFTEKSTDRGGEEVKLDFLSQKRVDEVKKRFNLSSRSEALRILISLGFEKISQF